VNQSRSLSALILRFARWLAVSDRTMWIAAMAAETDAAEEHRISWAFGCLWAALADRLVRDRWFLLSLIALPALALLIVLPAGLLTAVGASKLGVPINALVPTMLLGPLPCAWLLGKMRPFVSPIFVGTIGFLAHQTIPLLAMWVLLGVSPVSFWAPNLTYYNMPPVIGLLASWVVWISGAWCGARPGKGRTKRNH
jgi:hypothetical protein